MSRKRVTTFKNGSSENGKVVFVPESLEEFKTRTSMKHAIKVRKIFNQVGGEIDDIELIETNDILYLSQGENFSKICEENTENKDKHVSKERNINDAKEQAKEKHLDPAKEKDLKQEINLNDTDTKETNKKATSDWIKLNVGGKHFMTSKSTITNKEPCSMLARMFAEDSGGYLFTPSNVDETGAYLIDRSPKYFEPILNYLRNGELVYDADVNPEGILIEARFFGIDGIVSALEQAIASRQSVRDDLPLTRRDIINALIRSACTSELRFQGVNLAGADLSKLDLRNINFKYANLQGCKLQGSNLSWCYLERADLSKAMLDGAQLLGVKSLCANMEGALLRNCNFEDPAGSRANMEGVNLKGANLEGSCMGGVNLRVATLKHAVLRNCDLRAAVLAGADLENCDLSGSDLHEANLRGANLKDAAFELMLTPLHMSQTIR